MFLTPRLPSALAGLKEVPKQLVIAKWGKNESVNGSFTVGPKTVRVLPALQKLLGFDTVALDFEHNTLPGTEAYKADKEPRNVAANSPLSVVEGVGIVAHSPAWTPSGIKSVSEGLHPDISPVIKTDDAGEVVFVHSAALCRQGAVGDLKVFSAAEIFTADKLAAFSAAAASGFSNQSSTATTMDYKKLLTLLLGLDANASDTDIESACKTYADNVKAVGDLKAHTATITALTTKVENLEKKADASERQRLMSEAILAGKIVPHSAKDLSLAQFEALLKDLPADQVPLAQRTPDGLRAFTATTTAQPNEAEESIRKQLGISEADWKKV